MVKPILFYTLEAFERHPMIDAIELVFIDGWEAAVKAYRKQYGIKKLKWIIPGGASVQEDSVFSYLHVTASASGILTALLKGESGEAFNIADRDNDVMLRELANFIANHTGRKVIFASPNAVEKNRL